jgi:phospholipid/cholesterol/gamma-HCH transport system ATP-binding protein
MPLASDPPSGTALECVDMTLGFGAKVVLSDLRFSVPRGAIFAIMGGSGSGKSTLLRALVGLLSPRRGTVLFSGHDVWAHDDTRRCEITRRFGVLFQSAALWSSMTISENVALPLQMLTPLAPPEIAELVRLKLALVGLEAAGAKLPSALSGGMRKRAGLARALALDPDILFLDEPSAGLDPITSRRLDELVLELRDGLGVTVVIVSHELASLLSICDDGVFLDADSKTIIGRGAPRDLRDHSTHPTIQAFMRRSVPDNPGQDTTHAVR